MKANLNFFLSRFLIYMFISIGVAVSALMLGFLLPLLSLAMAVIEFPALYFFYLIFSKINKHLLQRSEISEERYSFLPTGFDLESVGYHSIFENKSKITQKTKWIFAKKQISAISAKNLSDLVDRMPSDGAVIQHFSPYNQDQWAYRFRFKSSVAEFNAAGIGADPRQAFEVAQQSLLDQVNEWHEQRENIDFYLGKDQTDQSKKLALAAYEKMESPMENDKIPTVLIIEDDVDIAIPTEKIFKKLGCNTILSNGQDGASHQMSLQDVDFIVLDWVLGKNFIADELVKSSVQIIDSFEDLREYFRHQNAKVITYSSLDKDNVQMPENKYFQHVGHWQKPLNYEDLTSKASDMLKVNGF